ncbi:hypothetical protein PtA15_8A557 [Puccinia triticina]|uniref:ATPase AAA-type core domain-containing protein n=1 Tax=Puccinia triticina TaxID=208348 RepID=A0ABY7CQV1_9BASI|nr:uncharacterized protein PtA15_8A557 [Puccinia triticina]WAQ87651.1 hypothetical protein PtA15_8A557 [Puccinia triticina]
MSIQNYFQPGPSLTVPEPSILSRHQQPQSAQLSDILRDERSRTAERRHEINFHNPLITHLPPQGYKQTQSALTTTTDQETQAKHPATSDSPSMSARILEKAESLHLRSDLYQNFRLYLQDAGDDIASEYLNMLDDLVSELKPDALKHELLIEFAHGKSLAPPLERAFRLLEICDRKTLQEKFIQLAFIRRYPNFYLKKELNLDERAQYLEVPVSTGINKLKAKYTNNVLELDVIAKGFTSKYLGHDKIVAPTLKTLINYVKLWESEIYLAPYTCLIGPTMIGKSRLLQKIAEEVCVLYICLRPEGSTGEPKRSLLATNMLPESSADYEVYYVRVIAALLLVTVRFFQSKQSKDSKEKYEEWNKHQTTAHFRRDVLVELENSEQITSKTTAAQHLVTAVNAVQAVFSKVPGLKVLLAIDEASSMLQTPTEPKGNVTSWFRLFRRALSTIQEGAGIFAILVDTTSRVSNFLPIDREDRSSRALGPRGKPRKLFAPIYMIRTFDLLAPPRSPLSWDQLFSSDRLCKYGVPFFDIYLADSLELGRAISYDAAIPSIVHFALKKLLCSEDITDTITLTAARALALLGPTVGVPLHGQAHLNVELTASHAAHVGYLDPTREYQHSFYPSQPIYALAANNHLHQYETLLVSCIKSLTSILCQGNIGTGDAGECASRIILLCAMNKTLADMDSDRTTKATTQSNKRAKTVDRRNTNNHPTVHADSRSPWKPVPVEKFLETLTGLPANDLLLGSINDTHKKKLLGQGMMFWNHFHFALSTPTVESLMKCIERGAAIQCHSQQPGIDHVLPIYLKDETVEMDQTQMTFCGIQVKNRENDSTVSTSAQEMTHKKTMINTNTKNPYLVLHFSLRHKGPPKKSSSNVKTPQNCSGNVKTPQDYQLTKTGTRGKQKNRDPQQASLVFYGLDSFPFLSAQVKNALQELVNVRTDLVSRHAEDIDGQCYAKDLMLCAEQS